MTAPSYTKWFDRKLWTIHESICLMLGLDPETPWLRSTREVGGMDPLHEAFEQYCELAMDAMKDGALQPFSPWDLTRPPLERRVIPRRFLEWLRARDFPIPDELAPMLDGGAPRASAAAEAPPSVPSVYERLGSGHVPHRRESPADAREQILGAALAALRGYPERCGDASEIRRVIEDNAPLIWPDTRTPPLPPEEIERLVGSWLNRIG